MEYKIVKARFPNDLENIVNELIVSGWVPQGSAFIFEDNADRGFAGVQLFIGQPMIRMPESEYNALRNLSAGDGHGI